MKSEKSGRRVNVLIFFELNGGELSADEAEQRSCYIHSSSSHSVLNPGKPVSPEARAGAP